MNKTMEDRCLKNKNKNSGIYSLGSNTDCWAWGKGL